MLYLYPVHIYAYQQTPACVWMCGVIGLNTQTSYLFYFPFFTSKSRSDFKENLTVSVIIGFGNNFRKWETENWLYHLY